MNPVIAAEYHEQLLELLALRPADFILKYQKRFGTDTRGLAQQLNGLQKARKKLPSWFGQASILYPPNLNLEQCSSEITAAYKASLVCGDYSIDLTGGFGVDSYHLAQVFKQHHYVEQNEALFQVASANFKSLGSDNVHCHLGSGMEQLQASETRFDLVYIDPSRRVEGNRKFVLEDCEPNVIAHQELLRQKAHCVMYKFSPLLDITALLQQLNGVSSIHIISVKNECKEVLVLTRKEALPAVSICTVNFLENGEGEYFNCFLSDLKVKTTRFSKVLKYLYEPNASLLKSGAFDHLAEVFGLEKLHANTHLYTSDTQLAKWPGRIFEVATSSFEKVNVISRNHPMTPKALLKKYRLQEGADKEYLVAFTDIEKPKAVFARRVR